MAGGDFETKTMAHLPQEPAIPVQHTVKSTHRAISKLNGDELPKLRRVKRPELSGRIALYNTFTKRVLNTTLNCWFKQHANVMDNLEKQQAHVYKSMCRMQRLKRRVQKDEHERRREEIRRLFQRQRKKQLMRNVVAKFKANVIRKRQERLQEEESQNGEGNGISSETLAKYATGFRRMTEPNVSTDTQVQKPEEENTGGLEMNEQTKSTTPKSGSPVTSSSLENSKEGEVSASQGLKTFGSQRSTSKRQDNASKTKPTHRRKDVLLSIPEVEASDENNPNVPRDTVKSARSTKEFVRTQSTKSLPIDPSKQNLSENGSNRRGSLPSKYKEKHCVSAQSRLSKSQSVSQVGFDDSTNPKDNVSPPIIRHTETSPETKTRQHAERVTFQSDQYTDTDPDHVIASVERANSSPDMKKHHKPKSPNPDILCQQSNFALDKEMTTDKNDFSHQAFYSSTGQNHQIMTADEKLSESASLDIRHEKDYTYSDDDYAIQRVESYYSPHAQSERNDQEENGRETKTRKKNLTKQMKAEKAMREARRSSVLDSESFTRYTRRDRANVTAMYGLPKRTEFNPPTRKVSHEQDKLLRGVQDTDLQSQVKIDNFFKDLFEPKDSTRTKPVKKTDDDKPKKPALTLAGVLSQLYMNKDSSPVNKNSFDWLKKCQYLRVYDPSAKADPDGPGEKKVSSWDKAERKLKAGFLAMNFINNR